MIFKPTFHWHGLAICIIVTMSLVTPATSRSDELGRLLAAKRCEVVDRLLQIHAYPDPADQQNRFLILSRADKPQDYVQCAFDDLDRHMLCEAASGYFYDVPRTMHLPPTAIAARTARLLHGRLGAAEFPPDLCRRRPSRFRCHRHADAHRPVRRLRR